MEATASRKVIGVLGGMGPLATTLFHAELVRATAAERDQDHVPVVIVSEPTVPDRTAYLLGRGPDPRPALHAGAGRLHAAGADLLVIPCNTANVWLEEISARAGLVPIDWLQIAAEAVADSGATAAGILATTGTVRAAVYQSVLAQRSISVVLPDDRDQDVVMAAIYAPDGVKSSGTVSASLRASLEAVARRLVERGADVIVLGCTELPVALSPRAAIGVSVIDPAVLVARRAVEAAGGRVRSSPLPVAGSWDRPMTSHENFPI